MTQLTIGMATYDDFDGVFFSIQAIRMYHREIDVKFLIIDNNPTSVQGKATSEFIESLGVQAKYVAYAEKKSTFVKYKLFELADTPYILCMDCHIFFEPGSLKKLLVYYEQNPGTNDLLQGPLVYDDLKSISTHFDPVWRGGMFGIWATDQRGGNADLPPFEIPMQGAGMMSCRKEAWVGVNSLFRGFGGEEGYVHEKFRKKGAKVLCLPFLRWMHRFRRPLGPQYPNTYEDRIRNYFISHLELGMPVDPIIQHFSQETKISKENMIAMQEAIKKEMML